jgi:hypothetical protein
MDLIPHSEHTGFNQSFFIVTWVEFSISIFLLIARCFTSIRITHHVASDLYLSLATFVLGAGSMAMITAGAANGLGISQVSLTEEQLQNALLYGWLNQLLALIAIGMGKVTIVAFLQQIQGYHTRYQTFFLWCLAGSNLILNCIVAVVGFLQCDPVPRLWDETIPGVCNGRKRLQIFAYVQGSKLSELDENVDSCPDHLPAWSAICDFSLALYPVLILARVQIFSRTTKIGLCVLMSSGIV